MTKTQTQAPAVNHRRPRLVELEELPAAFSSARIPTRNGKATNGSPLHAAAPAILAPEPTATPSETPPPQATEAPPQHASQRLVRYMRRAAGEATSAEVAPPATAESPESSSPARRARRLRAAAVTPKAAASAPDVQEELVAVVAECLGIDIGTTARAMYGRDDTPSRDRIRSLLEGLGPRGKEMAIRLARLMLDG